MSGLNLITRYRKVRYRPSEHQAATWLFGAGLVLVVFGMAMIVVVLAWSAR